MQWQLMLLLLRDTRHCLVVGLMLSRRLLFLNAGNHLVLQKAQPAQLVILCYFSFALLTGRVQTACRLAAERPYACDVQLLPCHYGKDCTLMFNNSGCTCGWLTRVLLLALATAAALAPLAPGAVQHSTCVQNPENYCHERWNMAPVGYG